MGEAVTKSVEQRFSNLVGVVFTVVIVIYAASGPLTDFVRWFIEATTPGFDDLSRRDQRVLFKEHWLGAGLKSFERNFLLPTGMILGLPLLLSFVISFLALPLKSKGLNWALAALSAFVFAVWIAKLFGVDVGILPSAKPMDFVLFPIATVLTIYLTWRLFGAFIVGFCLFWIVYFVVRGALPEWTGIFAGADSSLDQSIRSMVLNFWSQTGGMFGQPLQVVSGNVLIFLVFGSVLMASGAGALLMKIANRLTGGITGGAVHAAVASSALFGTLSGAAISNVVSTGVMTIPVIKRSGFKPSFAGAVEASASTGGQIMPPVMGVVAFFVAGQIGLEYRYIVVAAIVPAIFYYIGIFLTVYFEARRQGIGALPRDQRPKLTARETIQCLVFILPLGVMSYMLFAQPSVQKAGFLWLCNRPSCSAGSVSGLSVLAQDLWRVCRRRKDERVHRGYCRDNRFDRRPYPGVWFLGASVLAARSVGIRPLVRDPHCCGTRRDCPRHGPSSGGLRISSSSSRCHRASTRSELRP